MFGEILIYLATYIGLFAVFFFFLSIKPRLKKILPKFNEKNPPFITIIIPAYNEERGIEATIKSALGVDYPRNKMEILVIDDGSRDNTYKLALKFKSKIVKVFHKENGGKGTAINFAIAKARGEFIFTMDADSIITPNAVKNQLAFFSNPKVMCVSPILAVYKPSGIIQRIQQIEYFLGVFLREVFTSLNAANVTPGAFSAYRKSFFDRYGGFDEHNLTEDLEIALRIQYNHFILENATNAIVYTETPRSFRALLIQRKRWYVGLLRNLSNYRKIFSREYGALGMIVLPLALLSILVSLVVAIYLISKAVLDIKREILLLKTINFDILSLIRFDTSSFERFIFSVSSNPLTLFTIILLLVSLSYMFFAKRRVKEHSSIIIGFPLFMFFYSFMYAFWWAVSIIYAIFNRSVKWR
jgi:cellulose synthase/poly-beta-1,6-N-acetylglucosamine synthase-like glycosyltransferase